MKTGQVNDKPRKCEKCGDIILKGEYIFFLGYMLVCEHCYDWKEAS